MEFVHFERVGGGGGGKSFDMVVVYKAGVIEKGGDEFVRITGIEMKHLEPLKTWLDDIAEVVYTESSESLQWKALINEQVRRPDFWAGTDEETGKLKVPGMIGVLHPEAGEGGGEEEQEESEESEAFDGSGEGSEESDEESDDDFDELVSEDDDEDEEEEDEEEGEDWDELERRAEADDKKRKTREDDDEERKPTKKRK